MRIVLIIVLAILPLLVCCSRQVIEPRVKGGLEIDKNVYPFVGKIVKSGKQVCTCVLVDQRWILTLKTCIDKNSLPKYRVYFKSVNNGEFNIRRIRKSKELKEKNANVILLELSVIIERDVPSIAVLNGKGKSKSIKKETKCIAVGFSSKGQLLTKAKLTARPTKKCSKSTCGKTLLFDIKNDASVCQSDSGTPVFCQEENKWFLTALSFVKKGCQKKSVQSIRLSYSGGSIRKAIKVEQKICVQPGCVTAAAQVIERMDKNVNPCDNFYKFACGNWLKMSAIPEGFDVYTTMFEMNEDILNALKYELEQSKPPGELEAIGKAKGFYKNCLDTAKIEANGNAPLHKLMEQLGGLSLLGSNSGGGWNSSAYSFEELFVKASLTTTSLPILVVRVTEPTFVNQIQYQLNISSDDSFSDSRTASINVLRDLSTKVNYENIVERLYEITGLSLKSNDTVGIISYGYFRKINSVLELYPDNVIANYIVSKVVMTHVHFLPKVYRDITRQFLEATGETAIPSTRQDDCVAMVINKMPDVATRIFVKKGFLKSEELYILDLADQNKKEFKKILDNSEWMTDFSKKASKEKVDKMSVGAVYPESVYNDTFLNQIHDVFVVDNESPLQTVTSKAKSDMMQELDWLKTRLDNYKHWPMPPLNVNAVYHTDINSVAIFAGILQPNIYSHDRPEYMNYGAIGTIIGHEIIHGFTSQGILHNQDGKMQIWWQKEDYINFVSKAKCFVDTWSNFTVPGTDGLKNNGELTFDEVLCDHEGVRISYQAYRKKIEIVRKGKEEARLPGLPYTPNQLFFLNLAQTFCQKMSNDFKPFWNQFVPYPLHSTRINGLMQNSKDFGEAWRCPVGSYMNPTDKCSLY